MKRQLIKEALVATLVMLLFTFAISFIPFKYSFLKVISEGVFDTDFYDLYYSGKELENTKRDPNIVLVEVAGDRASIADQVNIINEQQPAVIGVDATFDDPKDPSEDSALLQAIKKAKHIVLANRLKKNREDRLIIENNFFDTVSKQYASGYTNFFGDRYTVIRNYVPFLQLDNQQYASFTSCILGQFSPAKFEKLKGRHNDMEIINYTGNLKNYTALTVDEFIYYQSTGQLLNLLKNKIVLLGFFVKKPPLVLEDLYFSPLNEEASGKSYPDMYGVVVHANILSMALSGKYGTLAGPGISYLSAAIIIYFFLVYILWQYSKPKQSDHGSLLFILLGLIMIICYIFLQIYNLFLVKVALLPVIISLVACVEVLGLYKALALWLNKKWNYRTVFKTQSI